MKLIDKAKQAAMEGAVTKALEYLEKDPETNIPKLMELVDKFTPQTGIKVREMPFVMQSLLAAIGDTLGAISRSVAEATTVCLPV